MPINKMCRRCGAHFKVSPSRNATQYCGDQCARAAGSLTRTKPRPCRPCAECGTGFQLPHPSSPRAFCGDACARVSKDRKLRTLFSAGRVNILCQNCGLEFQAVDTAVGRCRRKFCSRKCANAAKVGNPAPNKTDGVVKPCEICGTAFRVPDCRAKTARYCSYPCQHEAKRRVTGAAHKLFTRMPRTCQWCGGAFEAIPAKVACGQGKYCSRRCLGFATTAAQGGRRSSIEITTEAWLVERGEIFDAQRQVGPWLVDFYIPARNLVIEVDGDYWHTKPKIAAKDRQKNGWMRANGYEIVRIWERAVRAADFSVIETAFLTG